MRAPTAALVLAVLLAGCGAQSTAQQGPSGRTSGRPSPSSSPSATPSPSATAPPVVVTVELQETTAKLRVGQTLLVRPAAGRPGRATAALTDGSGTVLQSSGGGPTTGWRYLAVGRGTAHVAVLYGPQCVPGELCPMFRGLLGRVTVTVA